MTSSSTWWTTSGGSSSTWWTTSGGSSSTWWTTRSDCQLTWWTSKSDGSLTSNNNSGMGSMLKMECFGELVGKVSVIWLFIMLHEWACVCVVICVYVCVCVCMCVHIGVIYLRLLFFIAQCYFLLFQQTFFWAYFVC